MDNQSTATQKLINRRGVLKGQLTRFWNSVKESTADGDNSQLKIKRNKIEDCWETFQKIQFQIEETQDTTSEEDQQYRIEFEEMYYLAVTEYDKISNQIENRRNGNIREQSQSTEKSNGTTSGQASIVKLAALNVPTFGGDYRRWSTFHDMFVALIHDNEALTDVQRFFYLQSALTGDALKVIQSFETSGKNYSAAWKSLKERFNNKRILVQHHTKAIVNLKTLEKESAKMLRSFIDELLGHMKALENLGYDTYKWGPIIIHIITTKLDAETLRAWETQAPKTEMSEVPELINFLNDRFQILEAVEGAQSTKDNNFRSTHRDKKRSDINDYKKRTVVHTNTSKLKCYLCSETHPIYRCSKFLDMSVDERKQQVIKLNMCKNCLSRHAENKCKFRGCKTCGENHNNLLHDTELPVQSITSVTTHAYPKANINILLSTAIVKIYDQVGQTYLVRALLDSGSQSNFISNDLSNKLHLPRKKINCKITGVNSSKSHASYSTTATIQARLTAAKYSLEFLTLPKITTQLPADLINSSDWKIPDHVKLADPTYAQPGKIDMLIGAEIFYDILLAGRYKPKINGPIFQETVLGWIVAGPTNSGSATHAHSFLTNSIISNESDLNKSIIKFWQLEEISNTNTQSVEEKACVEHFERTVTRDETGRFVVELPLKDNVDQLGESRTIALRRFLTVENRFRNHARLQNEYIKFMTEYEQLQHMTNASKNINSNVMQSSYFMPHHAVVRDDSATTKIRVVFDASCKSVNGTSLNDILMKGPVIQDELVCIISRFRTHKYVLSADVEKMYRQIRVAEKHQPLQKILWRSSPDHHINEYCLQTITYGTTPASYLATACLKKLADDNKKQFPIASSAIESDFYMDDYLGGANTLNEASELRDNIIQIMNSAGFRLRKWVSNEPGLLSNIDNIDNDPMYVLNVDGSTIKTLGLYWNPKSDTYQYKVNIILNNNKQISKRNILSTIATIFDPLGLIGPIVILAKIIMQKLWQKNIGWDEPLSENLNLEWGAYLRALPEIEKIIISRQIIGTKDVKAIDIHGFADASERAYGACIYLRATDKNGTHTSRLIAAKSRVAPIKTISLARLELCAAVLLVRLAKKIVPSLRLKINNSYFWSDSTIVLAWINSPSSRWKTFVSHRVSEIQEFAPATQWGHVKSEKNPADIISRGCSAEQLKNNILWWEGPAWMKIDESKWKKIVPKYNDVNNEKDIEEKKVVTTVARTENIQWYEKYSSLGKLLRITSYVLRWKNSSKHREKAKRNVSTDECNNALIKIIKLVQSKYFENVYKSLKKLERVTKRSKLFSLNLFLDENKIIRVGGRLNKSDELNREKKNPIVLPAHCNFTLLIFRFEHFRLFHAGPQALLAAVREKYWPLSGRNTAKNIVHKCIACFRTKPLTYQPIQGELPAARIETANQAFETCGVDFAGPIAIKSSLRRKAPIVKGYICVFVCFLSKAVHIELVGDLTTNAFIAALRRFWARRGICKTIYSDNATNFVGANRQLREVCDLFASESHIQSIQQCAVELNVNWKFIPPRSPHFRGLWEAAVKSIKGHLRRTLGNAALTYEEMNTILVQVESCLNSRPITPLSSDPSDLNALTPGHFLIGRSLIALPEPNVSNITPGCLRRWQRVTQLFQQIWQRWSREYLSQLQERTKWAKSKGPPLKLDDLVILKEDNLPPLCWRLGRVVSIMPGKDGVVRVATVKTSRGEVQRAARMLCPVPMEK